MLMLSDMAGYLYVYPPIVYIALFLKLNMPCHVQKVVSITRYNEMWNVTANQITEVCLVVQMEPDL